MATPFPESNTAFPETLKRLVKAKGTSITRLYDKAEWKGPGPKPSKGQLDKAMTGERPLRLEALEMLAVAADEKPTIFAEVRLARARALLDPDQVPFHDALANLARIERVLRTGRGRRDASGREGPSAPRDPRDPPEPPSPAGG